MRANQSAARVLQAGFSGPGAATRPLIGEPEVHHVAVLDDIFLAFQTHLASLLGRHLAAERDEIVVGDGLGADEALLEVGVDGAGRLWSAGTASDGPRAGLLGSDS